MANEKRVAPDALCEGELPFFSGRLEEAYERCKKLLSDNRDMLDEMTEMMIEQENKERKQQKPTEWWEIPKTVGCTSNGCATSVERFPLDKVRG